MLCPECGQEPLYCVCCESCGHTCPRDQGEFWCPVCLPKPLQAEARRNPEENQAPAVLDREKSYDSRHGVS